MELNEHQCLPASVLRGPLAPARATHARAAMRTCVRRGTPDTPRREGHGCREKALRLWQVLAEAGQRVVALLFGCLLGRSAHSA